MTLGRLELVLAIALVVPAFVGCTSGSNLDEEHQRIREEWKQEQPPLGERGFSAEIDVKASPVVATGQFTADTIEAPLELVPEAGFPEGHRFLFFENATVNGQDKGLLLLEGDRLEASKGRLTDVPVDRIEAGPSVNLSTATGKTEIEGEDYAFPSNVSEAAEDALFFGGQTDARVEGLEVSNFENGYLVSANDSREVSGPITVDADRMIWSENGTIVTEAADLSVGELALSGNETTGHVEWSNQRVEEPDAVFGHDGTLRVEPGHLRTRDPIRVTQVLQDEQPLIDARIEIDRVSEQVIVEEGETEWVQVLYREETARGDAILSNVTVTGTGADMLTVPVERPPSIVEELWNLVSKAGPAAPVFGLVVGIASPFIAMAEALGCLAGGCPENSPYPSWIDAGEIGTFFVKVEADQSPGAYKATATIEGKNYDPIQLPLTIEVVEANDTASG